MNDETLASRVVLFSRFLRDHGFKIFSSGVMDALKGLEHVDICEKGDFYAVLRTNLVSNELEWKYEAPKLLAAYECLFGR